MTRERAPKARRLSRKAPVEGSEIVIATGCAVAEIGVLASTVMMRYPPFQLFKDY
jgi:hypothetical protein